jgi:SNF2 family DNA or RNA helicase
VEGVNWLLSSYFEKCSSILADEMGLGKTVNIT